MQAYINLSIHPLRRSFVHFVVRSFLRSCVHACMHSFAPSIICMKPETVLHPQSKNTGPSFRTNAADLPNATFRLGNNATSDQFVIFPVTLNSSAANGSVLAEGEVDVQLTSYATNPLSDVPSAQTLCLPLGDGRLSPNCSSGAAGSMQTVTLRQAAGVVRVSQLARPIQIGFGWHVPPAVNGSASCDGGAVDACTAEHDALLTSAAAKQKECAQIAKDLFWGWNNASGRKSTRLPPMHRRSTQQLVSSHEDRNISIFAGEMNAPSSWWQVRQVHARI